MKQSLKSDGNHYDSIGDVAREANPHEPVWSLPRVKIRNGRDDIWQLTENMRRSVETVADLLMRTAVEETRARFLAEASLRLLASTDEESTFSTLSRLFVPILADGACVFSLHGGERRQWRPEVSDIQFVDVHCRALAHADAAKEKFVSVLAENLAYQAERHVEWTQQVFQRGRGNELSGQALLDVFATYSGQADMTEALQALDLRWLEGWPLVAHDRVLGAIFLLGSTLRHEFEGAKEEILQSLAHCASLAVDNARIHQDAQRSIRARERLMAVAAHDLRNSLSLASMTVSLLDGGSESANGAPPVSRLATLRKGLGRMQRLVDDLLDFSSIEAGGLSIVPGQQPVAMLVEETLEAFRDTAAQKGIHLSAHPPAMACIIEGDAFRLLQVLSNLVGNAMKFTPRGGTVTITIVNHDDDVGFSVSDTGCGIAPAELPHVFEAYWRTTRARSGGVGLGLSIAKGIVESHGGTMWVESRLGEGTTFFFKLPKKVPVNARST